MLAVKCGCQQGGELVWERQDSGKSVGALWLQDCVLHLLLNLLRVKTSRKYFVSKEGQPIVESIFTVPLLTVFQSESNLFSQPSKNSKTLYR
ncbi:hypothetical protein TNCV_793031 [Trichonephila clavipes]|nr:hypothetical protein TNCV_793031 [Trichonephila clavipes]